MSSSSNCRVRILIICNFLSFSKRFSETVILKKIRHSHRIKATFFWKSRFYPCNWKKGLFFQKVGSTETFYPDFYVIVCLQNNCCRITVARSSWSRKRQQRLCSEKLHQDFAWFWLLLLASTTFSSFLTIVYRFPHRYTTTIINLIQSYRVESQRNHHR